MAGEEIQGTVLGHEKQDFILAVARGRVTGYSMRDKFGHNPDIDTGTAEDVWPGGGLYTGQPIGDAETVEVFSSGDDAADDTAAGTGARTVRLQGLDENWEEQEADVTLAGTTPVATTELWQRVNRVFVLTAGSGGENAGVLNVRHTTTTDNVFVVMPEGDNQTLIACWTIPAGKMGYLMHLHEGLVRASGAAGSGTVELRVREPGGVYRNRYNGQVSDAQPIDMNFNGGISFPEKTDIKIHVSGVSDSNSIISARFVILLVDA